MLLYYTAVELCDISHKLQVESCVIPVDVVLLHQQDNHFVTMKTARRVAMVVYH